MRDDLVRVLARKPGWIRGSVHESEGWLSERDLFRDDDVSSPYGIQLIYGMDADVPSKLVTTVRALAGDAGRFWMPTGGMESEFDDDVLLQSDGTCFTHFHGHIARSCHWHVDGEALTIVWNVGSEDREMLIREFRVTRTELRGLMDGKGVVLRRGEDL